MTEAIVNAVAHRDYASNASVQVMLFSDRLEVWNPGELPAGLSPDRLTRPHASIPRNPLVAGPLFLAGYIEQATAQVTPQATPQDKALSSALLRELAATLGLPTPQATPQAAAQVTGMLNAAAEATSREALQVAAQINDREHFRKAYLEPLLGAGWLERTIPDKPTSPNQRYRLTAKGRAWLEKSSGS